MIFPRASLKRSPRTRTRKNTTDTDTDITYPPSRSSILSRRKTRPPPLQIIPELSENEFDIDATQSPPVTARPLQSTPKPRELVSSCITLSAYTFSIDDALFMFSGDMPRSPALSACSSTSDGASSDVPSTPRTSDDEDDHDFALPTPRFRPERISIRPLCITKTRSLICQEDEDIQNYFGKEEMVFSLPVTEDIPEQPTKAGAAVMTEAGEEAEQDFYLREFEDFITFSAIPSPTFPARRDSLILVSEALPAVIEIIEPKPRGRSRLSKPLPLLPPVTPPASSFPLIPTLPLVQTTAQKSVVRRKRNVASIPDCPLPSSVVSRPLPRIGVPLDIEERDYPEETSGCPSRGSVFVEEDYHLEQDTGIYSQPSFTYTVSPNARPLPPAIPETPLCGMYGDIALPRSSTDSDGPRSSVDSTSSFVSSASSDAPISPFSFSSSPSEERLRSRWSSSTLGSIAVEPPRPTILSPFRGVFGSRPRQVPPPQKTPPRVTPSKPPKNKHCFPTTPLPLSMPRKHIRRQGSQSSTSSAGTSPSGSDSRDGSPSGLKRKPIPVAMFLRAT